MKKRKQSSKQQPGEALGQVRVLLVAPGYPWQFGAYQNQQALLGVELVKRGFDVYWNSAFRQMGGSTNTHSVMEAIQADAHSNKPPTPKGKQLQRANLFTYIGVPLPVAFQALGRGVLASAVNAQLKRHSIDAILFLMDANQIFMDEPFNAYSIIWFPNHFMALNKPQEKVLRSFDVVASLAPSDAEMLREAKYQLKEVVVIPHIIEKPTDLPTSSLKILRKKYTIPPKKYVILVNCGNYEKHNRKSLDTILLAFQAFREKVPEAFLYLKAVSSREIMISEGFSRDVMMEDVGLPLQDMLEIIPLPPQSYLLHTSILDPTAAWELLLLADVLLMPSKSEGFGLPMLEAQLMGVPVVTTKVGAMKDYTINGIAVPPSQPVFMTAGLAMMPDLNGVITALTAIHNNTIHPNTSTAAIEWIENNLSSDTIGTQFETLIRKGVAVKAVDGLFQRQSTSAALATGKDVVYGETTDLWVYSLQYHRPERLDELMGLEIGNMPPWVLLWSQVSTLDWGQIDNIRKQGWGTTIPPTEGDVLFLLSQKTDGSTFPRDEDLHLGNLDPDGVVLIRTDRYIAAAKYLAVEYSVSQHGLQKPTAYDILRAALAQKSPLKRAMNMNIIHVVVAKVKPSNSRKKTQIVQDDGEGR